MCMAKWNMKGLYLSEMNFWSFVSPVWCLSNSTNRVSKMECPNIFNNERFQSPNAYKFCENRGENIQENRAK